MTTILDAGSLFLDDVHRMLGFEEHLDGTFTSLLSLLVLTEFEKQELQEIRRVFRDYYSEGKISEGEIKFLFLSPLLRLSGFYSSTIKITLEENIASIFIEDEDTNIRGRMDILAVNKTNGKTTTTPFWILVIESKNSSVEALEGLPQLLTYAYKSLEHQELVWGLTTNGLSYRFIYLQQGDPPTYQILPEVNLIDAERSLQLLQVLKAICKLQHTLSPV